MRAIMLTDQDVNDIANALAEAHARADADVAHWGLDEDSPTRQYRDRLARLLPQWVALHRGES